MSSARLAEELGGRHAARQIGRVVVAIVGFRNAADIERCVAALSVSTFSDFEVLICENGGLDAYTALREALPGTLADGQDIEVILAPGNLGFAGGVNVCLNARPDADAWWVLNPDTQPDPGALAAMVRRLEHGDCEAVGCTLYRETGAVQSDGGRWRSWIARAVALGAGRRLDDPLDPVRIERTQNYLTGASMLISRAFLEAVGPMREDYFLYAEELEWCLRGVALGMRLGFAPEARVLHNQGATTGAGMTARTKPRTPVYLDERNRMLLTRDLYRLRIVVAAPAALAQLYLRYGRRGAWKQFGYGVAGWWAGLRGERGAPKWLNI